MRCVFAGTPEVAVPSLEAIAASRHEVVGVVTRPDAAQGRSKRLVPSPVAQRAEELGIPVLKPEHPRDPEFQTALKALEPDCCPVVAYGAMLPQTALDIPEHGWVNLHFSLLPAYRGAAPVQRAVWAGEQISGATTFRIVKAMDAGPIFGTMTQALTPHETSGSLFEKLTEGGAELLVRTLDGIEDGSLEAREQPEDGVSYADKITVEDAQIDWKQSALAIDRQVRACTPAPGAWTLLEGERFKVGPVTLEGGLDMIEHPGIAPGQLLVRKNEVLVGTGTATVRLGRVKAFGKKEMPAADWARGVRLESGVTFG
ncbi:methionyl-tRNA formyltransferase [Nocardioides albertanoniae]|uniref:Methionyl-tRNA formyltransferase n=1 Tax=Nocardioides albertanoniae TaxID=1175486 RepID=A0A543A6V3_9ACTN|nr:methionyl-tRNA formyltransferase [Nocardioides albertanoniae]TQL68341.1 methionyl-tRNA formyltransferase [Nocardioides albertanoniae]